MIQPFLFVSLFCYFSGLKLNLVVGADNVEMTEYAHSPEFDLLEVQQQKSTVIYATAMEPPTPYIDITFTLHIGRKSLYYLYSVITPCIIFSILTLVVFCLPPESREKVTLGIMVLLGLVMMLWAIADKLPQNGLSIPLIGIYIIVVIVMAAISVIMSAVVLCCCSPGSSCRKVPNWIHWLVLEKLGCLLCVKSADSNLHRNQAKKHPLVRRLAQKGDAEEKLLKEYNVAVAVDGNSAKHDGSLQVRK